MSICHSEVTGHYEFFVYCWLIGNNVFSWSNIGNKSLVPGLSSLFSRLEDKMRWAKLVHVFNATQVVLRNWGQLGLHGESHGNQSYLEKSCLNKENNNNNNKQKKEDKMNLMIWLWIDSNFETLLFKNIDVVHENIHTPFHCPSGWFNRNNDEMHVKYFIEQAAYLLFLLQ